MGQYFYLVNISKKEFLHPHDLHAGLKALEFTSGNVPKLLTYLLTSSTGAGGGDFKAPKDAEYEGRWAGDRIAITGDYDESGMGLTDEEWKNARARLELPYSERMDWEWWTEETGQSFINLYGKADAQFTNISEEAMAEYNKAVDMDDMKIEKPIYKRDDVRVTMVGTHPDDPKVLAENVEYHEAREKASEYRQKYGFDFVEMYEQDDVKAGRGKAEA